MLSSMSFERFQKKIEKLEKDFKRFWKISNHYERYQKILKSKELLNWQKSLISRIKTREGKEIATSRDALSFMRPVKIHLSGHFLLHEIYGLPHSMEVQQERPQGLSCLHFNFFGTRKRVTFHLSFLLIFYSPFKNQSEHNGVSKY